MRRSSWLAALTRAAFGVLFSVLLETQVGAQSAPPPQPPQPPLKEVNVSTGAYTLGDPAPDWAEIVPLPDAQSTQQTALRLFDTQFFVDGTMSSFIRRAVQVNDAASLGNAGQIPIGFVPDYQQLRLHWVRILRGAETIDQTRTASIRFLQRETGLERGLYSGEVTAAILLGDLRVGDTIDFAFSITGQNPVFGNKFIDVATWNMSFPTALRRLTVKAPVARPIRWRVLGDDAAKPLLPQETVTGDIRRIAFEEKNLAPLSPEPLTPPDVISNRSIQFSEFASWEEIADWAGQLFQTSEPLNEELSAVVTRLKDKSPEERVVGALEFVQTQIRYFSVSLGESSHRPTQPNKVAANRYGDCKDKTFLLIALLKELGVDARPVLLRIGSRGWIGKLLPSPTAFDHVIAQANVGGRAYYLDPTRIGQHGRLDRMGQAHEHTQVLVVAPGTHEPTRIATPNAAELTQNEISETATFAKLAPEGQLLVRSVWKGLGAEGFRVARSFVPPEQMKRAMTQAMELRYPGAALKGDLQVEDDQVNNVLTLTMTYDVPNLAGEKEGTWFVRFIPTNMRGALPVAPTAGRSAPLLIPSHPYRAKYAFEARFPDTVSAVRDPVASTVDSPFFLYNITSTFRGNVARTVIDLETRKDAVPAAELAKFNQDVRSIGEVSVGAIIVGKGDVPTGAVASGGFAATIRARVQETVDKTSETIKSGKVTGSDLAETYCARSGAYGHLGKMEEALQDAAEAFRIAPNMPEVLACRGYTYALTGDFDKAISSYSKSIAMGGARPESFRMRGLAKFYAGRLDEAAEDFQKASDRDDKEGRLYTDLWLSWTLQRLNKPIPEAIVSRAKAEAAGEWPRPALAMLAGGVTPEALLDGVRAKVGDEQTMALTEGYFFVGQLYFARGDKDKAREFFEKTRQMEVLPYLEHIAAGFELQKLGAAVR
jgi:lipoprotein NlpI/transglutaminase-like putative cysteine protease